jgi:hypothetical protein
LSLTAFCYHMIRLRAARTVGTVSNENIKAHLGSVRQLQGRQPTAS